jgi:hypothetical protein
MGFIDYQHITLWYRDLLLGKAASPERLDTCQLVPVVKVWRHFGHNNSMTNILIGEMLGGLQYKLTPVHQEQDVILFGVSSGNYLREDDRFTATSW